MEWFKFYANTSQRLAVRRLDPCSFRLWVEGRCYIASVETDGLIPAEQLPMFGAVGKAKYAMKLVNELLWLPCDGGWIDAGWLDEQDAYEKIVARRKATAERVERHRNGVTNSVGSGVSNGSRREEIREEKKREDAALPAQCDHGASAPGLCAFCRNGIVEATA